MEKKALILFIGIGVMGGCDAQTGSEYQGEVLATINGTLTSQLGQAVDVEMGLLTQSSFPGPLDKFYAGVKVPVTGSFPSKFKIELYEPPWTQLEAVAWEGTNTETYGFSFQVLAPIMAGTPKFPLRMSDCILGDTGTETLVVLYLSRDLTDADIAPYWSTGHHTEGEPWEKAIPYFGVSKKGYHLVKPVAFDARNVPMSYRPVPEGLDREIVVELKRQAGPDCVERPANMVDGGLH